MTSERRSAQFDEGPALRRVDAVVLLIDQAGATETLSALPSDPKANVETGLPLEHADGAQPWRSRWPAKSRTRDLELPEMALS